MSENIRPGKWLYGLGIFIIAAGLISFVILLVVNISGAIGSFQRVAVPGTEDLVIDEAGKYTIYYEYQSVFGGRIYRNSQQDIDGMTFTIKDKSTNNNIDLDESTISSNYSIGSRHGISVFQFTVTKPGTYELSAQYRNNTEGPQIVLAIGNGFAARIVKTVFCGLAIFFIVLPTGVLTIVLTYFKRRKCMRKLMETTQNNNMLV